MGSSGVHQPPGISALLNTLCDNALDYDSGSLCVSLTRSSVHAQL
jgi:hypothetical protein